MHILDIKAIRILKIHGSVWYMCNWYKITKNETFKISFVWRGTILSARILQSSLDKFFYHLMEKQKQTKKQKQQSFPKQNEVNNK